MGSYTEDEEAYMLEILSSDAYFTINKKLLAHYGPNTAVFLTNLIDKYKYFSQRDMLKDGWFFAIYENQTNELGLSTHLLRKCKSQLIEDNIIETKMKGVPAKEWYRLHLVNLSTIFSSTSRRRKHGGLEIENMEGYIRKNKYSNNKEEEEEAKEKELLILPVKSIYITPILFEKFWAIYPRKNGKGQSLTAWENLCKKKPKDRPTWRAIKTAVRAQKISQQWADPQFIPYASTWLNQNRWLDDPSVMKPPKFKKPNTGITIGYKEEGKVYRTYDREM